MRKNSGSEKSKQIDQHFVQDNTDGFDLLENVVPLVVHGVCTRRPGIDV